MHSLHVYFLRAGDVRFPDFGSLLASLVAATAQLDDVPQRLKEKKLAGRLSLCDGTPTQRTFSLGHSLGHFRWASTPNAAADP